LWVPDELPTITISELQQWKKMSFPEVCAQILHKFIQKEMSFSILHSITKAAFSTFEHHSGSPIPLVQPAQKENSTIRFLETFHGPTLAFKDIGLQVLARLVNHFLKKKNRRATILMETSGDTGPAALSAAANLKSIDMYCLYPKGRVSRVQELQCTTAMPLASNLHVYRTEGTTDDQAATIKAIFDDHDFVSKYACCSMNSINVGRIATQSSYYVYTYLQCVRNVGDYVDYTIPTGAFGNALGGFWSKQMGLPIRNLLIATNANDICHRAVSKGDFTPRASVATVSPAMDIQLPYNFERFLHCVLGGDEKAATTLIPLLNINAAGDRLLPAYLVKKIRNAGVQSMVIQDNETLMTVTRYWNNYQYLLDPHSAIAVLAAERYRKVRMIDDVVPCIAVLTAHPSKFERATFDAIGMHPPNMPERVRVLDELAQQFDTRLGPPSSTKMGGMAIPEWIKTLKEDIRSNAIAGVSKL